jgi:cytoskeleton protein RodZ
MATRRKRSLNFLPAEPRAEPVIDVGAYPVDIGVGELMRLTRERLGHELQSVANQLRIRLSYLEAIEESRFRDLPGTTYAVGFVRSYADYLGLDGADIVRRFREEAARIHGQTKLILPALTAEGKLPRAAVLLVSAVGLAVLYGAWYYRSSQEETELPLITEVPDRLVALTPDAPSDSPPAPVRPTESSPSASSSTMPGDAAEPAASQVAGPGTTAAAPVQEGGPPAAPSGTANAATPANSIHDNPASTEDVASSSTPIPTVAAPDQPAPSAGDARPPSTQTAAASDTLQPTAAGTDAIPDATGPDSAAAPSPAEPPSTATAPAVSDAPPASSSITVESIPPAPALPSPDGPEAIQQAAVTPASTGVVVLEARMDSWIKVVDAKGKTVTNRVLKAGERYEVPDQPGLILRTGNAGGLDVLVGGRKAPPLGDVGAVFQKIVLERDRLLNGTAVTD